MNRDAEILQAAKKRLIFEILGRVIKFSTDLQAARPNSFVYGIVILLSTFKFCNSCAAYE